MKCNHCGLCCRDPCTQINLTIGDIWRIADFLKGSEESAKAEVPVEELFKEKIGINPFADPDIIHYDLDLGLNLPCKFRINKRCSIYNARPLNCRLFPYWILVEAPSSKLKDILSEHACIYDMTRKRDYERYKDIIGGILLKESEFFKIDKKVNISRIKGFEGIKEDEFRAREFAKISLIKERIKRKIPVELIKELIDKNLEKIKENKLRIEEAEKII